MCCLEKYSDSSKNRTRARVLYLLTIGSTPNKWMSKEKKVDSNREKLAYREEADAKEKTLQMQREIAKFDEVMILHDNLANRYKQERHELRMKIEKMVQTDREYEDERLRHNELIALEIAEDRKMIQAMMCKRRKSVKDTKFF